MKLPNSNPTPPQGQSGKPVQGPGASPTARPGLTTGQQLDQLQLANRQEVLARVAEVVNRAQGNAEQVLLDIRGRTLTVQASIGETRLEVGDWVKIMRAGNELQLMAKLAAPPEAQIAQALAQRLPWQQRLDTGLAQLLSALKTGLRPDPSTPPRASVPQRALPTPQPLPLPVRQAVEQLVARLPSSQSFTPTNTRGGDAPAQVRQWIAENGLFAESRLARTPDPALPDLKLALGRIIGALLGQQSAGMEQINRYTPSPSPELVQAPLQFPNSFPPPPPLSSSEPVSVGQMLRLLAGMLNRITVNQLHSQALTTRTTVDAPAPTTWLLELPWLTPQGEPRLAQLRLEYDGGRDADKDGMAKPRVAEWRFSLAMELDQAGPLYFEVALRESQVSARVWAEQQATLKRVHNELPALRAGLVGLGLEVVDLDCRRGTPQAARTQLEHRLVDTRA